MCFRGRVIQDLGNDLRSPIMCFDFWALKIWEGFSTIPFKSIYRDLRTVGAQGGRIEAPLISIFRRALTLGGGLLIKEGPTLLIIVVMSHRRILIVILIALGLGLGVWVSLKTGVAWASQA